MADITNIVFDLGRVLIDFQYRDLLAFLRSHGLSYDSVDELLDRMELYAYESGELTDEEFIENLTGLLTGSLEPGVIESKWVHVFSPIPEMISTARGLMESYRVFILSNASSMHWDHLHEAYDIASIGHGQLASFQAGVRKPDARIYQQAEALFGLDPAETVFIDDLAENAEGARACGWSAITHVDPQTTRSALEALGVQIPVSR